MKSFLPKIVTSHLHRMWKPKKISRTSKKRDLYLGFTLIELLVAALIASLLVSVLLGFLVGVLDSDRKETAKSNAQEELQAAISYIADDLQEAIYIYGSSSLATINSQLPHTQATDPSDVCNPTSKTCTPILVFWKRSSYSPSATAKYSSTPTAVAVKIGCMPYGDIDNTTDCAKAETPYGREIYTYSLVAYYLKNDDPTITGNNVSGWSQTARILRWELKDGYVAYCATGKAFGSTGCPLAANISTRAASPLITTPVALVDTNSYFILPDKGFNRPDFSTETSIAAWKKFDNFNFSTTGTPFVTLVDYMDDTSYDSTQGGNSDAAGTGGSATATSGIKIPIGKNVTISDLVTNPDCDDPSVGVGNTNRVTASNAFGTVTQRVPADFSNTDGSNPSGLSSFYLCVAPSKVTARMFMRGNAIARVTSTEAAIAKDLRKPTQNNASFFPVADVRSFGRSQIDIKN